MRTALLSRDRGCKFVLISKKEKRRQRKRETGKQVGGVPQYRVKLTRVRYYFSNRRGHYVYKQLDPKAIVTYVSGNSTHNIDEAPLPVSVHLISPRHAKQSDVAEGIKKAHSILCVRPLHMKKAHEWLCINNEDYNDAGHVPPEPVMFKDLPAGSFKHTITDGPAATASAASAPAPAAGVDILTADPSASAQTVHPATYTNARASVIISDANEDLMKSGRYTTNSSTGGTVVLAAYKIYPYWLEKNVMGGCTWMAPYGKGGPGLPRSPKMSRKAWACLQMKKSNGIFAKNPDFILAEFSVCRLGTMHAVQSAYLRSNPQISTAIMKLTEADIKTAAAYQDSVKKARQQNEPIPVRPANVKQEAVKALLTSEIPNNYCMGTANYAIYQRNILMCMQLMFGVFHTWCTITPADIEDMKFFNRTGVDVTAAPTAAKKAQCIADDAYAVAATYLAIQDIYIEFCLGFDTKTGKSHPKGGLLGKFRAYAIQTEPQTRGSPHMHVVACNEGFPRTVASLLRWMQNTKYRGDVLKFAKTVLDADPGFTAEEVIKSIASKPHTFGIDPEETRPCSAKLVVGDQRATDLNFGAGSLPVEKQFVAVEMSMEHQQPTKKWSEGQRPPSNLECSLCGHAWSMAVEAEQLALSIVGQNIIDLYNSSNIDFNTIDVTPSHLLPNIDVGVDERTMAKAICVLFTTRFLEHHHGKNCFKYGASRSGSRQMADRPSAIKCRYNIPIVNEHPYAIVINDTIFITPENNDVITMPDHIHSVEYQFGVHPMFPYSSSHSNLLQMIFLCNLNFTLHAASSGAMFYISKYTTKIPKLAAHGSKQATSYARQLAREAREDDDLEAEREASGDDAVDDAAVVACRRAAQRANALTYPTTSSIEVPISMAAIFLMQGSTMQTSVRTSPINMNVSIVSYLVCCILRSPGVQGWAACEIRKSRAS